MTEHLHQTARYYRAHLQQALLKHVPREIIHLKKGIATAKVDKESGVTVEFQDGTSIVTDILIGADGIGSVSTPIAIRRSAL